MSDDQNLEFLMKENRRPKRITNEENRIVDASDLEHKLPSPQIKTKIKETIREWYNKLVPTLYETSILVYECGGKYF